jgi:hypothetical protein
LGAVQAATLTNYFRLHARVLANSRKEVPQKVKKSSGDPKTHRHLAIAPQELILKTIDKALLKS